jgi:hypothetical protein
MRSSQYASTLVAVAKNHTERKGKQRHTYLRQTDRHTHTQARTNRREKEDKTKTWYLKW